MKRLMLAGYEAGLVAAIDDFEQEHEHEHDHGHDHPH